jgi:tRNA/rRNA methyltransferase
MEIVFILVEPAVPENIGAAARALKTMGFSKLRLVNPVDHLADKAKWLAHGSGDILESAEIFGSLAEASGDLDFIVGTTAKGRSTKADYHTPEEAREIVLKKQGSVASCGIVFGREESGLTNEELRRCDIASTIPLHNPYPSINLAQTVMIYAYVFSSLSLTHHEDDLVSNSLDNERVFLELKRNTVELLKMLEIDRNENIFHRMLERLAITSDEDSKLLLSFAKKVRLVFDKK